MTECSSLLSDEDKRILDLQFIPASRGPNVQDLLKEWVLRPMRVFYPGRKRDVAPHSERCRANLNNSLVLVPIQLYREKKGGKDYFLRAKFEDIHVLDTEA